MKKFDKVINDIKGYWVAVNPTIKDVKFTFEWYSPSEKTVCISVMWLEKNADRLGEQISSLIFGGYQFGLTPYYPVGFENRVKTQQVKYNPKEGMDDFYLCKVYLKYEEDI